MSLSASIVTVTTGTTLKDLDKKNLEAVRKIYCKISQLKHVAQRLSSLTNLKYITIQRGGPCRETIEEALLPLIRFKQVKTIDFTAIKIPLHIASNLQRRLPDCEILTNHPKPVFEAEQVAQRGRSPSRETSGKQRKRKLYLIR